MGVVDGGYALFQAWACSVRVCQAASTARPCRPLGFQCVVRGEDVVSGGDDHGGQESAGVKVQHFPQTVHFVFAIALAHVQQGMEVKGFEFIQSVDDA